MPPLCSSRYLHHPFFDFAWAPWGILPRWWISFHFRQGSFCRCIRSVLLRVRKDESHDEDFINLPWEYGKDILHCGGYSEWFHHWEITVLVKVLVEGHQRHIQMIQESPAIRLHRNGQSKQLRMHYYTYFNLVIAINTLNTSFLHRSPVFPFNPWR